jgi:anti-sigma factor RsiW
MPAAGSEEERFQILMMGFLDGELTAEQDQELRAYLLHHPAANAELHKYRQIHELAHSVRLREPQDYEWDRFWQELYNRMERRVGWIVLMVGLIVTSAALIAWMCQTSLLATWMKVGLISVLIGLVILFLNVLRGRRRTLPFDRFKGVHR